MAIPTGKQGLRGTFEALNQDSRKITTLESNHRQSVSEHLASFKPKKDTPNSQTSLQNLFKQQTTFGNDKKTSTDYKKNSLNTSGSSQGNQKCFCGKPHSGGRRECSWFCWATHLDTWHHHLTSLKRRHYDSPVMKWRHHVYCYVTASICVYPRISPRFVVYVITGTESISQCLWLQQIWWCHLFTIKFFPFVMAFVIERNQFIFINQIFKPILYQFSIIIMIYR